MRKGAFQVRALGGLAAILLTLAAPLTLAACTPTTYAGISLKPGAADPELQSLARRGQGGDKHAQLELGIRYEEGRGVPANLDRASYLYEQAARTSGGRTQVYVPPVAPQTRGHVVTVGAGPRQPGLMEAATRLQRLSRQKSSARP
jgi:hypothetical protein